MAGNYPDAPSWRFAYDKDGTTVATIIAGVITTLSSGSVTGLNDESSGSPLGTPNGASSIAFIFPEKRDVDGYFWSGVLANNTTGITIDVSTNTTNGVDGTWTQIQGNYTYPITPIPFYRSAVRSSSALAVTGIRFNFTNSSGSGVVDTIHLYGEIIPGANPNRLALWHPTLNQRIAPAYFDWGDVPRSSSADRTFRVKNLSGTLQANSVRVAQDVLTDSSVVSIPGQHTLSMDSGTTFLPQVNIGNLAAGAISSQVLILRRNTPSNAQLGAWAHRVFAEANSWS